MSGQQDLFPFFRKNPRSESFRQEANKDETQPTLEYDGNEMSAPDAVKTRGEALNLPDYWSMKRYENFREKYDGLII